MRGGHHRYAAFGRRLDGHRAAREAVEQHVGPLGPPLPVARRLGAGREPAGGDTDALARASLPVEHRACHRDEGRVLAGGDRKLAGGCRQGSGAGPGSVVEAVGARGPLDPRPHGRARVATGTLQGEHGHGAEGVEIGADRHQGRAGRRRRHGQADFDGSGSGRDSDADPAAVLRVDVAEAAPPRQTRHGHLDAERRRAEQARIVAAVGAGSWIEQAVGVGVEDGVFGTGPGPGCHVRRSRKRFFADSKRMPLPSSSSLHGIQRLAIGHPDLERQSLFLRDSHRRQTDRVRDRQAHRMKGVRSPRLGFAAVSNAHNGAGTHPERPPCCGFQRSYTLRTDQG